MAAWVWFDEESNPVGFVLVAILYVAGLILDQVGQGKLPEKPKSAMWFMEAWILRPLSAPIAIRTLGVR